MVCGGSLRQRTSRTPFAWRALFVAVGGMSVRSYRRDRRAAVVKPMKYHFNVGEGKECTTVYYLTDVEGNVKAWEEFKSRSLVFGDFPKLKTGHCLVYGGDALDSGNTKPEDFKEATSDPLKITGELVDIYEKNEGRVAFVLGNRDLNKLRLKTELKLNPKLKFILNPKLKFYWVAAKVLKDAEQNAEQNMLGAKLRTLLKSSMGSNIEGYFKKPKDNDGTVFTSVMKSLQKDGAMYKYLNYGVLFAGASYGTHHAIYTHSGVHPYMFDKDGKFVVPDGFGDQYKLRKAKLAKAYELREDKYEVEDKDLEQKRKWFQDETVSSPLMVAWSKVETAERTKINKEVEATKGDKTKDQVEEDKFNAYIEAAYRHAAQKIAVDKLSKPVDTFIKFLEGYKQYKEILFDDWKKPEKEDATWATRGGALLIDWAAGALGGTFRGYGFNTFCSTTWEYGTQAQRAVLGGGKDLFTLPDTPTGHEHERLGERLRKKNIRFVFAGHFTEQKRYTPEVFKLEDKLEEAGGNYAASVPDATIVGNFDTSSSDVGGWSASWGSFSFAGKTSKFGAYYLTSEATVELNVEGIGWTKEFKFKENGFNDFHTFTKGICAGFGKGEGQKAEKAFANKIWKAAERKKNNIVAMWLPGTEKEGTRTKKSTENDGTRTKNNLWMITGDLFGETYYCPAPAAFPSNK